MIAKTPEPPYFAVVFSNTLTENIEGYNEMADQMLALAETQPGFLGFESARDEMGISISYWESEETIKNWHLNAKHRFAQKMGYEKWYQSFCTRICKVERAYNFVRT